MTEIELRTAIAEDQGWRSIGPMFLGSPTLTGWPPGSGSHLVRDREFIPDYLNDLNAMRDAVKTLPPKRLPHYITLLCGITSDHDGEGLVLATAAQQAQAFIKTIRHFAE